MPSEEENMKNSPLEKLMIDTKKLIYSIQIGSKEYIVNAKNMELAFKKATKEHFGGIGMLIRGREMQVKDRQIKRKGSWHYISSKYIYSRLLKERNIASF